MEEQNFEEISLKEILNMLSKWRGLIAILTITAIAASAFFTSFFVVPIYKSSAVLMVTHDDAQRTLRNQNDLEDVVAQVSRPQEMTINTYLAQMNNQALLERVIEKLELPYSVQKLSTLIKASAMRDTRLIDVAVEHNDPYTAALIANTLSAEFIEFISDINQQRMKKSVEFLQEQRDEVNKQMIEKMNMYNEYETDPRSSHIVQMELNSRLNDAIKYQSQIIHTQIEYERLLAGQNELASRLEQEPAVQLVFNQDGSLIEEASPLYLSLRQTYDQKQVELMEKHTLIASMNRAVILLEKQFKDLQTELNEKLAYERAMQTDIQLLEKNYSLFTERIAQAQVAQALDMGENNLTLVSSAVVPMNPIKPNKMLNIAIAGILGLMASVMLAFFLELMDNTIKNTDDVRRHLDLPILAQIPKFK